VIQLQQDKEMTAWLSDDALLFSAIATVRKTTNCNL